MLSNSNAKKDAKDRLKIHSDKVIRTKSPIGIASPQSSQLPLGVIQNKATKFQKLNTELIAKSRNSRKETTTTTTSRKKQIASPAKQISESVKAATAAIPSHKQTIVRAKQSKAKSPAKRHIIVHELNHIVQLRPASHTSDLDAKTTKKNSNSRFKTTISKKGNINIKLDKVNTNYAIAEVASSKSRTQTAIRIQATKFSKSTVNSTSGSLLADSCSRRSRKQKSYSRRDSGDSSLLITPAVIHLSHTHLLRHYSPIKIDESIFASNHSIYRTRSNSTVTSYHTAFDSFLPINHYDSRLDIMSGEKNLNNNNNNDDKDKDKDNDGAQEKEKSNENDKSKDTDKNEIKSPEDGNSADKLKAKDIEKEADKKDKQQTDKDNSKVAEKKPQNPDDDPSTSNNASSSRKRKLNDENSAKTSSEAAATAGPSTSTQPTEDKDKEEDKDAKKKKNRCAECRKKVGLTGFQCRCGGLYCAVHRYSDKHDCTFNYREHGAQEIRRNNPVVVGEKIQKI